jgi:hypothetical protein
VEEAATPSQVSRHASAVPACPSGVTVGDASGSGEA